MKKKTIFLLVLIFVLVVVDQIFKIYIKTHFYLGEEINIIGQWLKLHFIENEGMAFGMSFGGIWGKFFLTSFRIGAAGLIAYICYHMIKKNVSWLLLTFTAMIFAGAVGNIIDCVFYGKMFSESVYFASIATIFPEGGGYATWFQGRVVDMIQLDLFTIHFPATFPFLGGQIMSFFPAVFNLADAWITIGIFAMLIFCYKQLSQFLASFDKKEE